ncbi:MAG: hypothetical protein IJN08_01840 [Clostridia bacterium]|nr:hypothetical protein [Clostridia bacterium]
MGILLWDMGLLFFFFSGRKENRKDKGNLFCGLLHLVRFRFFCGQKGYFISREIALGQALTPAG